MKAYLKIISVLMVAQTLVSGASFAKAEGPDEKNDKPVKESIVSKIKNKIKKNKNSISVPGYAQMDFVADQKEQTTRLRNPWQNSCYLKISLVLEDGTVIWKSDFLAPGESAKKIILEKTLSKGTYDNVSLKYECFAMNKKAELNDAVMKTRIVAK